MTINSTLINLMTLATVSYRVTNSSCPMTIINHYNLIVPIGQGIWDTLFVINDNIFVWHMYKSRNIHTYIIEFKTCLKITLKGQHMKTCNWNAPTTDYKLPKFWILPLNSPQIIIENVIVALMNFMRPFWGFVCSLLNSVSSLLHFVSRNVFFLDTHLMKVCHCQVLWAYC